MYHLSPTLEKTSPKRIPTRLLLEKIAQRKIPTRPVLKKSIPKKESPSARP